MGDVRYERPYQQLREAADRSEALRSLTDEEVIGALAAASRDRDPLLANVLATEAHNRMRRSRVATRHLTEGVLVLDADGRIVEANAAAERLLKLPRAEIQGRELSDVIEAHPLHGEAVPGDGAPLACPFVTREVHEGEARVALPDGSFLPIAYVTAPVLRDGSVEGAIVSFRDTTQRLEARRREKLMQRASELLTSSLDYEMTLKKLARLLVPDLAEWCTVHILQDDGNPTRIAVQHRDPEKIQLARRLQGRYPEPADATHGVREVLRTGKPKLVQRVDETLMLRMAQDDEHLELLRSLGLGSYVVLPLRARGRTLGAIALARGLHQAAYDERELAIMSAIADRAALALDNARLHHELRQSHDRYHLVVEASSDGVFDCDLTTGKVYYSPRWKETLGYAEDELDDTLDTWVDLVHPDDRDVAQRSVADFIAGRVKEHRLEHRLRHKDGTYRWVVSRALLQRDDEGRPIRLTGSNTDVTEQKRAQVALAESKQRYKALFEHSPYGVLTIDLDGTILAANDTGLRITGRRREEVVGRAFTDFVPEAQRAGLSTLFASVLGGEARSVLTRIRRSDGEWIDADAAVIPILVDGEVVGVHGVWRDVTAQTRWREELARSEERYRLLVESVTEYAIVMLDPEGRIESWGLGATRLSGHTPDDVLGKSFDLLYPPEDRERGEPAQDLDRARREGKLEREAWRVRSDGSRFFARVTLTPVHSRDGTLRGYAEVTRDLTERRAADERLRMREHRQAIVAKLGLDALHNETLDALFKQAADALHEALDVDHAEVLQLDPDRDEFMLRASRGWEETDAHEPMHFAAGQGTEADHTLASARPVLVEDLQNETRFRPSTRLVERGIVSSMSVSLHDTHAPCGVLAAYSRKPTRFREDDLNFLQSVANVLTGAIQRRGSEESLERRVAQRTAQLEQAMRDLQTFADSVSHDLRAPLRGTSTLLQFLHDDHVDALPVEGRELLAQAQREAHRATRLVRDLLSFSRSSHAALRREDVDLSALAHEAAADVTSNHPAWRTRWEIEPGLRVRADEGLARILLHNLLHNAAKYSAGADEPRVELRRERHKGRDVLVVRDNGVGFSMTESYRLFQPFARLSTAAGIEGTGLGLATAHRIVTRHGGHIEVESQPGHGATFRLTLEPEPGDEPTIDDAPLPQPARPGSGHPSAPTDL